MSKRRSQSRSLQAHGLRKVMLLVPDRLHQKGSDSSPVNSAKRTRVDRRSIERHGPGTADQSQEGAREKSQMHGRSLKWRSARMPQTSGSFPGWLTDRCLATFGA